MNTYHLARIFLLVVLGISLSSSSPFDRLKRSLDEVAEDGCNIPGVWACGKKREVKTLSEPQIADQAVPEPAKVSSVAAGGCNIPGVWACSGLTNTAENDSLGQFQGASSEGTNNFDDNQSDEADKCLLGNPSCRRKRMLKKMLKQARRVERSANKCPPGIWVC